MRHVFRLYTCEYSSLIYLFFWLIHLCLEFYQGYLHTTTSNVLPVRTQRSSSVCTLHHPSFRSWLHMYILYINTHVHKVGKTDLSQIISLECLPGLNIQLLHSLDLNSSFILFPIMAKSDPESGRCVQIREGNDDD